MRFPKPEPLGLWPGPHSAVSPQECRTAQWGGADTNYSQGDGGTCLGSHTSPVRSGPLPAHRFSDEFVPCHLAGKGFHWRKLLVALEVCAMLPHS